MVSVTVDCSSPSALSIIFMTLVSRVGERAAAETKDEDTSDDEKVERRFKLLRVRDELWEEDEDAAAAITMAAVAAFEFAGFCCCC